MHAYEIRVLYYSTVQLNIAEKAVSWPELQVANKHVRKRSPS